MLNSYLNEKNFQYFLDICKIPRPSFKESQIADYIVQFAKERGLWYFRDQIHNVIIKKNGSPGREYEPPLILQAHTDMVCNKEDWSRHDFDRDPIEVCEIDGWLTANGTTLGADDGAGVANILALLDEPNLSHPPLECIFTVQEENGMGGANNIDLSCLKGKRMIGLDGIQEGTTIYSASAVWACKFTDKFESVPVEGSVFQLDISGLTSGHGALMIGAQRANAIKVAARLLHKLPTVQLIDMDAGNLIHVIPESCKVRFSSTLSIVEIQSTLSETISIIKTEFSETDPLMKISVCEVAEKELTAMSRENSQRIINFLYLLPVGAHKRTADRLDQVEGSFNFSILRLNAQRLEAHYVCRSNYPVSIDDLSEIALTYADTFKISTEQTMRYLGHYVPQDTPLTQIWSQVYTESSGKTLGLTFMHSALDAGAILQKLDLDDLIVIMPTTLEVHTPRERMNIGSFHRTYYYLKEILARC